MRKDKLGELSLKRFFVILADEYAAEIQIAGVFETEEEAVAGMREVFRGIAEKAGDGVIEEITDGGFCFCSTDAGFLCSIECTEVAEGENFFAIEVDSERSEIRMSPVMDHFEDASRCLRAWYEQKEAEHGEGMGAVVLQDDYYRYASWDEEFFFGVVKGVEI